MKCSVMANQVVGDQHACYEVNSFMRGLQDIWTPVAGEVLLLKRDPDNAQDKYAIVVIRQSDGAILLVISPTIWLLSYLCFYPGTSTKELLR